MAKKLPQAELNQRVADANIDLAQQLEALAKRLRRDAKYYRAGELHTGYTGITKEMHAAPEYAHPAARAIQNISNVRYDVQTHIDRNIAELTA